MSSAIAQPVVPGPSTVYFKAPSPDVDACPRSALNDASVSDDGVDHDTDWMPFDTVKSTTIESSR